MAALAGEVIAPDEGVTTERFIAFLRAATEKRHPDGVRMRFNQARATACVDAEFTVLDGLAPELCAGLFSVPRTFRARIRFANATSASDREPDVRGMSIRVLGVGGSNLTHGVSSQDFVLNSHPVMMVPGAREFLELLEANEAGGLRRVTYFLTHPRALRIGRASRTNPTCHLDLSYWSTTPYLFGPHRAVKYVVAPGSGRRSAMPPALTDTYLRDAMRARLAESDATFDFKIQFQTDSRRMPIEDASVEWSRDESPYVPVGRIRIPRQSLDDPDAETRCEREVFNPWHALVDHRPLGGMNRARRAIYPAMAAFRAATQPV